MATYRARVALGSWGCGVLMCLLACGGNTDNGVDRPNVTNNGSPRNVDAGVDVPAEGDREPDARAPEVDGADEPSAGGAGSDDPNSDDDSSGTTGAGTSDSAADVDDPSGDDPSGDDPSGDDPSGDDPGASSSGGGDTGKPNVDGPPAPTGSGPCGPGGCLAVDPEVTPIEPPGPVLCGGVECGAGELCCLATAQCFDATIAPEECAPPEATDDDPFGRTPCTSNAQCGEQEFCANDNNRLCLGSGHCNPISSCGTCDDGGSGACRVCGCDGNTYDNIQTACRAGANVAGVQGAGCGESLTVGAGGSKDDGQVVTLCGTDTHCPADEVCCAITARCHLASQTDACQPPPAGTSFPCTTDAECASTEYCYAQGCSGPGGCAPRGSEACGVTLEPVCGCDGTSYTSKACAIESGVRIAAEGECEAP